MTYPHGSLAAEARRVLDRNWTGTSTLPSPRLYPHQWSWDSAFIAIGNRRHRHDRSVIELDTLFAAQWSNGMIPHIVFDESSSGYHPSKEWWNSPSAPSSPAGLWTSGLCQPAVHALAVRMVVDAADPGDRGTLLERWTGRLVAWHDYLFEQRLSAPGLLEIWHPWESGMDNAPMWDTALDALPRDAVPEYERVDTAHADTAERPTEGEYDAYSILVDQLRSKQYEPARDVELGFRIHDVAFNALLAHAEGVLAQLLERLGANSDRHRERAHALTRAIELELWDSERNWFFDADAATGRRIETMAGGSALALLCPLSEARREQVVRTLDSQILLRRSDNAVVLPTVAVSDPSFDSRRYWRGPVWANVTWLLSLALRERGHAGLSGALRDGLLELVAGSGLREYFDPHTGEGLGGEDFSWSAALVLDLVE